MTRRRPAAVVGAATDTLTAAATDTAGSKVATVEPTISPKSAAAARKVGAPTLNAVATTRKAASAAAKAASAAAKSASAAAKSVPVGADPAAHGAPLPDPQAGAPLPDPAAHGAPLQGSPERPLRVVKERTGTERRASKRSTADRRKGAASASQVPVVDADDLGLFEAAVTALNAGEFQQAESLFLEEAERSLGVVPQRAAIAYRQAALAARRTGNHNGADHWMRLAGREYLHVSEDPKTPLPFVRESALMAAKCFISVENLQVASKGLRRAQAIEAVLRADEDLMAPATAGVAGRPTDMKSAGDGPKREPSARAASLRMAGSTDPVPDPGPPGPEVAAAATRAGGRFVQAWRVLRGRAPDGGT